MTPETTLKFYDGLAEHYHLIFEDWEKSIERQANAIDRLIVPAGSATSQKILDCSCGIGTQALGLARRGHRVVASDLSPKAVARAKREAQKRGLEIEFQVADMTSLAEIADSDFDVVASLDNALPHLEPEQVAAAVRAIGGKLKPGGLLVASIRDYDRLIVERPVMQGPMFYGGGRTRRIVHQVWDWIDRERYVLHQYVTLEEGEAWAAHHFVSTYRCLLREELSRALEGEGFDEIRWMMPDESGYFQPLVLARRTVHG